MKGAYEASPYKKVFSRIEEFPDGMVDMVSIIYGKQTVTHRFNLSGSNIRSQQYGVNIVRMSDGTVRKVIVK